MGWWKIQGTEDTIGDGPLDALGSAVQAILAEYAAEFGRKPTHAEWEALLRAVLGSDDPGTKPLADATVTRVEIKTG